VDKLPSAAVRWHGRLGLEATTLTIAESQLALSALGAPFAGDRSRSRRCAPAAAAACAADVDSPDRLGSLDAEQATGRCRQNVWPWFRGESDHTPHVAVHRELRAGPHRLRCLTHRFVDAAVRILQRDLDHHEIGYRRKARRT
jgi:hypothetical protein